MDEGRKRVLLIAASILAARSVAQWDRRTPAFEAAIADAITVAERILSKIDSRWPTKSQHLDLWPEVLRHNC